MTLCYFSTRKITLFTTTMFTLKNFKHKFEVHPRCLSKDWEQRFLETLQKEKNRTVVPIIGAILEVKKINSVDPPKVHNGKIIVSCNYQAIAFSPSMGEIYSGRITLILPLGILVEAEGMVKVMIQPAQMLSGYKFDVIRKVFSNGIHSYQVGDKISFRLINLKYKSDEINCIGSLKDVKEVLEDDMETIIEPSDEFVDY